MANWHGYFREAAGPGWALLGDAGHFKDPTPAQGISDALRQAEHLADAVEAGLGGAASIDDELGRWWRWRVQDALEMHWFAADLGAAGASPVLNAQILRDIAGDDEASEKLLRVLNHDIRPLNSSGRAVSARPRLVSPVTNRTRSP
jgi:menaquinone-9 beta-reductase